MYSILSSKKVKLLKKRENKKNAIRGEIRQDKSKKDTSIQ